jgi:hypothetical protein
MKTANYSVLLLGLAVLAISSCSGPPKSVDGWYSLFDGETLDGWTASEKPGSFKVEDGVIVVNGPRSHLFYTGEVEEANFKNFEFTAEVKTVPGSNSGIYFHTKFQDEGWPSIGYESQVWNTGRTSETPPDEYVERKMTGSLYAVRNIWKSPVDDNEWFTYRIRVEGKTVRIWINETQTVDYTESDNPPRSEDQKERLISSGTFALQAHDPGSTVYYRNLKVKPLPPDLPTPGTPLSDPDLNRRLTELGRSNFPLFDLHVHLKEGLGLEEALANARKYGFTYGIAVNCGLNNIVPDEKTLQEFLETYERPPDAYLALQAEGREWVDLFSEESISKFDYVFTDSMTWTNDRGKRMRLWIENEVEVRNPQNFMRMHVDRIEGILNDEPIDIYVNPTYLPEQINHLYDELWTEKRMDRVIKGLVDNQVALEINDVRRIPSPAFIKRAKEAGVKFTCGTNNRSADDLGWSKYCLEMIEECELRAGDMWDPTMK